MEKMNIIDILRDCPEGTKLYSLVHGEVELTRVGVEDIYCKPSYLNHELSFNSDGRWVKNEGECILFPSKENRDWTKFQRPFKDGDIIYNPGIKATAIFYKQTNDHTISHCFLNILGELKINHYHSKSLLDWRFASEEEKQGLFKVIKDNGYHWNSETKTLEKLPKFKVGYRIKLKGGDKFGIITQVSDCFYTINCKNHTHYWAIAKQDDWELVPNKFDINTLVPFESKVLVRDVDHYEWEGAIFGRYDGKKFFTIGGLDWGCCIPYEGNEHLLGKTIDCEEFYKNWK